MAVLESKTRNTQSVPTKLCMKCGKQHPLKDFYTNRDWEEQLQRDCWCKDCVRRIENKIGMREYFWENHRQWNERIWEAAKARAEKLAATNAVYQKTSEERRERILEQLTCQQIPNVMGTMYQYFDPHKESKSLTFAEAVENGEIEEQDIEKNVRTYSKEFNGYFNSDELEYLHHYYNGLEADFELNDINLKDTAKKVAKASLLADKALDDYRAGRCDFSVVKDALAQFDLLSKSGNFSASKRKPGENAGLGSWSELTAKLESSGHPCTRKIEWEQDDVDRVIDSFRYIAESLDLGTV